MTVIDSLLALGVLLAVATGVGAALQLRRGRVRRGDGQDVVRPEMLGADGIGEQATLLQFSTELCTRCPGVHRMLSRVASEHPGVRHLDVDLTDRPDIARRFRVLQTPTTLILDRHGAVQSRIGGVPGRGVVDLELSRLVGANADG